MTQATGQGNRSAEPDEALGKGAVEGDGRAGGDQGGQGGSLAGQLGHRDQSELLKDNDTDFPEPDAEAEHTSGPA
jgi:hypothetical protein